MGGKDAAGGRLRKKGRGVSAYFAEVTKTIHQNVVEGVQSAAGGNDAKFGRPPTQGRRPLGQARAHPGRGDCHRQLPSLRLSGPASWLESVHGGGASASRRSRIGAGMIRSTAHVGRASWCPALSTVGRSAGGAGRYLDVVSSVLAVGGPLGVLSGVGAG